MIRCPRTGREISTGRDVVPDAFGVAPVFFSRTYCPFCQEMHEWFAKDAWLCDPELPNVKRRRSDDKLHAPLAQANSGRQFR
jgi:hypothetical protein